eukprot:3091551-Prymnesium_polylepis.3
MAPTTLIWQVRLSVGLEQLVLLAAAAHQWYRAYKAEPPSVPPAIQRLGSQPTPPTLAVVVHCPYLQLTVRSAEAPALPLLQLLIGDEASPVALVSEKPNATMPLAVETALIVKASWYDLPKMARPPA